MQIVDTHAHFWDPEKLKYPWIEASSPHNRTWSLTDYQAASAGCNVEAMVFVECDAHDDCGFDEANWVHELAAADHRIAGVVARVPLSDSRSVEGRLRRLLELPLLKGIRDNIQGHGPGFALQEAFVAGVRRAHEAGLHFELCIKHHQMAEVTELVRHCQGGMFVLDHCGKPGIRAGLRDPWRDELSRLAEFENVCCKISGLVTEADWANWKAAEVLWYAAAAAKAFGPERIMFGSDWPVSEVAGGYRRWHSVARTLAEGWTLENQERFFRLNAHRIYRLS